MIDTLTTLLSPGNGDPWEWWQGLLALLIGSAPLVGILFRPLPSNHL